MGVCAQIETAVKKAGKSIYVPYMDEHWINLNKTSIRKWDFVDTIFVPESDLVICYLNGITNGNRKDLDLTRTIVGSSYISKKPVILVCEPSKPVVVEYIFREIGFQPEIVKRMTTGTDFVNVLEQTVKEFYEK
jgi:hypothetical protein